MEVGIRELRADLSRWIKRVEEGTVVTVTDRGRPVATIAPANGHRSKLDTLIAAGLVKPAPRRSSGPVGPPIDGIGPLSDFVLEDRR